MLYSEAQDLEKLKQYTESNKKSMVKIDRKTQSIIEQLKSTTRRKSSMGFDDYIDFQEMASKSQPEINLSVQKIEWSERKGTR